MEWVIEHYESVPVSFSKRPAMVSDSGEEALGNANCFFTG
jgi:hypothetical protein